jgi:hypothetical protein
VIFGIIARIISLARLLSSYTTFGISYRESITRRDRLFNGGEHSARWAYSFLFFRH